MKYLEYDKIIGKENVLRIDDWRHTKNITKESIVNEYIDMLNNNDIFILFTASTVIYDILRTGKPVIIVFIRGNDERKWDATKAIDREVLLEFNNSPLVHLVENIVDFGIVLQKVISNKNKTKFCFNSSSNTKKILQGNNKLKLYIGAHFRGHDTALCIYNPIRRIYFVCQQKRFTRFKHDSIYPMPVINKYIEQKNLDNKSVSHVI